MKANILEAIDELKEDYYKISTYIGENPELGNEEYKACKALTDLLKDHQFSVEIGTCGLATAFTATFDSGKEGPVIGYMAEYDALPEVGHACGHHLIGTTSVTAAIGLSKVLPEIGGKIIVFGTPAEETKGAKVTMAEEGLFQHLDVAMMVHPFHKMVKSGSSLAMDAIQFEFFGKTTHAAASPHLGINALDAVIQTFNSINALRQHITSDARIHGIITEGGSAANVTPDYAVCQFYVRAAKRDYVNELVEKVKNCANGAALQTGATVKVSNYEFSYDDMTTNETLSETFTKECVFLGINEAEIEDHRDGSGSMDMGNVSQVVPSIHPHFQIVDELYALHTREFRDAAMTTKAKDSMITAAKALACTAFEIITNPTLLLKIKKEFQQQNGQ